VEKGGEEKKEEFFMVGETKEMQINRKTIERVFLMKREKKYFQPEK
jgi:hypothetical protein